MDAASGKPDPELEEELESLEMDVKLLDRRMMIMRMNRSAFVKMIWGSVDRIDDALSDMDEKLMMKVNMIKSILNKYDSEDQVPDDVG